MLKSISWQSWATPTFGGQDLIPGSVTPFFSPKQVKKKEGKWVFLISFANILVPTWKILNLICEGLTHWSLMENICLFSLRLWVYYMTLEVLIWHSNHNLPTDSIKNLIIWPHIQLWSSALARHEQKMLYMQIVMQFSFVCFVFSASAADILRLKSYTQQQWNNTQFFLLYSYTCADWRLTRFLNITKQNLSEKKMPGFAHIETQCKHQRQKKGKGKPFDFIYWKL